MSAGKTTPDIYSKAIKLIASKLENVKLRVSDKFEEVEARVDKIDKQILELSEGIQVKINQDKANSVSLEEFNKLADKMSLMENTINSLQKEITVLKEQASKQKVVGQASSSTKNIIPPPPGMKPEAKGPVTIKPSIPTINDGVSSPKKPIIPSAPKSKVTTIPSAPKIKTSGTKRPVSPKTPVIPSSSPKKKRNISLNDDVADKDSLLEALKSIDSLVLETEDEKS